MRSAAAERDLLIVDATCPYALEDKPAVTKEAWAVVVFDAQVAPVSVRANIRPFKFVPLKLLQSKCCGSGVEPNLLFIRILDDPRSTFATVYGSAH